MLALLLIPAYALADRFTGGGWPSLDAKLPGRSLAWAAAACIGAGNRRIRAGIRQPNS